jgi:hypothetical protein
VQGAFAECGATIMGGMVSPIHGADGNVEFLVHARNDEVGGGSLDVDGLIDEALIPVGGGG